MAIARTKNSGRPGKAERHLKRAIELAPYDAYVANAGDKAAHIKSILGIEGDAVGTLNEQELHTKTLNGGFF
jgi:hypothetical protein